jgi:hypothetical protein
VLHSVLSWSCIRIARLSLVKLGIECGSWVRGSTATAILLFRNTRFVCCLVTCQAPHSVGIAVPIPDPGAGRGADGRHHGPATLPLGK